MAERSALSRSSLYAGIFGDETESRGSVSRPKDSVKSVESDTLSEKTSTSAVPPMKPSIKHASTHKPTSPWSTALRFAPRPKQKPNIPEKTIARVNRAVPQASVDQVLHRDGGISVAANDEKKFVNDGVKQIAAPPMDIPQDQVKKDKARARREVELFQCVAEQRDDLNPAVHTRKKPKRSSSPHDSLMSLIMSDYDPMYPNDYTQYTTLLNKHHNSAAPLQALDQQDDQTETDNDYAHRFRKFAPPAFYSQGTAARSSSREPVQQVKTSAPPGPPPPIPSELIRSGGPEQGLGPPPGPPPPRPQSLAARDSEPRPDSSEASVESYVSGASPSTHSPVRDTFSQEPGAHNFAERLMEKYGYKKGQGLGSEGNKGIINPLEMLKAQKGAPRGTIVNRDQDEAAIARDQYGEPSDVIVLSSALDMELHISPELSQEIEHGFIRRIILHTTSDRFRAFIQFSGMAGAYRAVRALEGSLLHGHRLETHYYPSRDFQLGNLDE